MRLAHLYSESSAKTAQTSICKYMMLSVGVIHSLIEFPSELIPVLFTFSTAVCDSSRA